MPKSVHYPPAIPGTTVSDYVVIRVPGTDMPIVAAFSHTDKVFRPMWIMHLKEIPADTVVEWYPIPAKGEGICLK